MAGLKFVDSHNMVAYLEKSMENDDFPEIVDFLNANPIRYALTVSHTLCVSCINQFWSTAKIKTVNNETQIHAKVEGTKIVISESSVRRDLQFNDEDEVNDVYDTPSHTKKIFLNMRRQGKDFSRKITPLFETMLIQQQADMGEGPGQPTDPQHTSTSAQPYNKEPITIPSSSQPQKTFKRSKPKEVTKIPQSSEPITLVTDEVVYEERGDSVEMAATTATSLDAEQNSGNINRTQCTAMPNVYLPQGIGSGDRPRRQETMRDRPAQTRFDSFSKQSYDSPLDGVKTPQSDKDRIELKELMEIYTKLSERVLDLETIKTAQAKEIVNLQKIVKKLERKRKSKTSGMNLFNIGTSRRRSLGEEDASKQGRNLIQRLIFAASDVDEDLDAVMDEAIEHVYEADKDVEGDAEQVFAAADEVPNDDAVNTASTEVNSASAPVTTAGVSVSTAGENITASEPSTPPTITDFEDEDLIIAQTLVKMRSKKLKVRVVMKEPSETATRPTIPPQQHDPKDKGKGKMVEQEKPLKKKDQINFDKEIAQRLQAEEQGELTIEEKSRLFVELMDKRKKHFARLKAEEQRRKPLTKAQKRNQICTYLKNMAGFTHNQLKNKSFDDVQKAFDKTMGWIDSFIPMDSEVVKDRAEGSETRAEGSSKRIGEDLQQESTKKQKIHREGRNGYYEIMRADGSAKTYLLFSQLLKEFDKEDLINLWKLVKAMHGYKMLKEAYERVL
ncbi:hypothetical protein Tco_0016663 [Tanacetum coccineum]